MNNCFHTKLIDTLLELGFRVVGYGASIDHIEEHMNFSNGNLRVNLTSDNNHISIIRSDRSYMSGGYDGCECYHHVSISNNIKEALEPFLLPKESIISDDTDWKYQPYLKRRRQEIREHNKWCKKEGLLDLIVPESEVEEDD